MPIKFPKTLSRRRLSGNALDEVEQPAPVPSFRVLERPAGSAKSFDGGTSLKRQLVDPQQRPLSEGQWDEKPSISTPASNLGNRGSGGTANSSHSGHVLYDSSSARYSSSSTLPSSSSIGASSDEISHAHPKPKVAIPPIPANSSGFSLRAAGRTFSFGRKAAQGQQAVTSPSQTSGTSTSSVIATPPTANRPRTHTETSYTSGGTARAPHVLDTKLKLSSTDDSDFSNMFEDLESMGGRTTSQSDPYIQRAPFSAPPPLRVDIGRQVTPAPYSSGSHNSQDALITESPQEAPQGYGIGTGHHKNPTPRPPRRQSTAPDLSSASRESSLEPNAALRRNSGYVLRKSLILLDGGDDSGNSSPVSSSRLLPRRALPAHDANERYSQHTPIALFDGETIDLDDDSGSAQPTTSGPTSDAPNVEDGLLNDPAFQAMARSAEKFNAGIPARKDGAHVEAAPKKVMTPAQFERYRQEKEMERANEPASDSDSSADAYDEDDEEERNKEIAKQRKTQEARMSVYRQQMMKVTGESTTSSRPNLSRLSSAAPTLRTRISTLDFGATPGSPTKVSDDDDEDIPLGILAAHGFPTKNRPPTQLRERSSQPNIRYTSETYPPPTLPGPGSTAGRGGRGPLPPFARHLPQDPYYGASLVNPSNRESLAFGNSRPASAYGGAPAAKLPPGGLVGVIASTERARAIRRGEPAALQAPFDVAAGPASPQIVNEQSAQIAQLTQAVMQQAQMMQQMQQMLASQSPQTQMQMQMQMPRLPPNMSIPPNLTVGPPQGAMIPRPASASPTTLLRPVNQQGRAMSMLSPNTSRLSLAPGSLAGTRTSTLSHPNLRSSVNLPAGYAASLAPSERSGLGPMRHRPISVVVEEAATTPEQGNGQSLPEVKIGPKTAKPKVEVEDDDVEWARVRAKREKKKGGMKTVAVGAIKEIKGLEGVFYPTEEDL